jgi:sialate O-acetylesterase
LPYAILSLVLLLALPVSAAVKLHGLFTDNMVLQRNAPVPVWGTATPGAQVRVTLAKDGTDTGKIIADVTASATGAWKVRFDRLSAGGPYTLTVTGDGDPVTLRNVLVGEVWLASGQSNMEYGVGHAINGKEEIAKADWPQIRVFTVPTRVCAEPQRDVTGAWAVCTPQTAGRFSAVAYFYARELHQALGVPIGIIHSAVSGTLAEAWTRVEVMRGKPALQPILDRYAQAVADYPKAQAAYAEKLAAWEITKAAAQAEKKPVPAKPAAPADPAQQTTRPAGLYNGKIAPLMPFRIAGVIWWQGEYNSERCEQYKTLFPTLIYDWRMEWGQGAFPFYFVQLQNLDIQPQPNTAHYDEMREAQLETWRTVPNTGMAVMADAGDAHDIHPPNKQEAARRLALIARARVYGEKKLVYSGPVYAGMKVEGAAIRLRFDHLGGGLVLKGDGGFTLAGADEIFHPATAKIDGNTLTLTSPDVPTPVAARYAWADNPACTLFNQAGLPATPFRTDAWPLLTAGKL